MAESRLQRWWQGIISKYLVPQSLGVSTTTAVEARSSYPTEKAMSSLAAFPWVWACVRAVSYDLGSLPLIATRTLPNGVVEPTQDPGLALLLNPSDRCTSRLLRLQLYVDLCLTGNAYLWRPRRTGTELDPIMRLHPASVEPLVRGGFVTAYRYQGTATIPFDEVVHIRDVSWRDDIEAAVGESPIRTLNDDLNAIKAAKENSAVVAGRGRPDFLLSAKDSAGFDQDAADRIAARWDSQIRQNRSAMVVGEMLEATPISITPADMQFAEQDERTTFAILAVFGVPPVRVGLPSANYGTSKQQMRTYWEGLKGKAALIDDGFSQLANPGVCIQHDFTQVEALQVSYTERLQRVKEWVAMGATPAAAARYEQFMDAPVPDTPLPSDATLTPRPAAEPDEGQERALEDALAFYLTQSASRYTERLQSASDAKDWQAWAREEERLLFFVLAKHLSTPENTERVAKAISGVISENVRINYHKHEPLGDTYVFSRSFATRLTTSYYGGTHVRGT